MEKNKFDLDQVALVTDRGYESLRYLQELLKSRIGYVSGVPLVEGDMNGKFIRCKDSFLNQVFWSSKLDVAALTFGEEFVVPTLAGNIWEKPWLHLYRNVRDGYSEIVGFFQRLEEILEMKNLNETISPSVWQRYSRYCVEQDGHWTFDLNKLDDKSLLAGCFALRSNCIADPFVCLQAYRYQTIVEEALRQFKATGGNRLYVTDTVHQGKLFIHLLGQTIKMIQTVTAHNNETSELKVPSNSMRQLLGRLNAIFALQKAESNTWIVHPIPKSATDALTLLGLNKDAIPTSIKLPQL